MSTSLRSSPAPAASQNRRCCDKKCGSTSKRCTHLSNNARRGLGDTACECEQMVGVRSLNIASYCRPAASCGAAIAAASKRTHSIENVSSPAMQRNRPFEHNLYSPILAPRIHKLVNEGPASHYALSLDPDVVPDQRFIARSKYPTIREPNHCPVPQFSSSSLR